jgi:hypothetical protein
MLSSSIAIPIIGSVTGIAAACCIIAGIFCYLRRRQETKAPYFAPDSYEAEETIAFDSTITAVLGDPTDLILSTHRSTLTRSLTDRMLDNSIGDVSRERWKYSLKPVDASLFDGSDDFD